MESDLQRLLRIVSGLAENTNSIIGDGPSGPETANGCPVLRKAGTIAARHTCELKILAYAFCALL
jgi:hypothetical protein